MATTGSLKQLSNTGTLARQNPGTTGLLAGTPTIERFEGMPEILTPPQTLDDMDISQAMVSDILLRLTYTEGEVSATHAENMLKLPYRLLDALLSWLQQEHMIEVAKAVGSLGRRGYVYTLTETGRSRAREAFERSQYIGAAPVPIEKYTKSRFPDFCFALKAYQKHAPDLDSRFF